MKNGSPDPKRMAIDTVSKMDLVNQLLDVMNNSKLSPKVREKSARSLGLLCVGGQFPHSREVLQGLLNTAKEVSSENKNFIFLHINVYF